MLHVDINKSHVNIIMLHVDIIYLACRGQKYATIETRLARRDLDVCNAWAYETGKGVFYGMG